MQADLVVDNNISISKIQKFDDENIKNVLVNNKHNSQVFSDLLKSIAPFSKILGAPDFLKIKAPKEKIIEVSDRLRLEKAEEKRRNKEEKRRIIASRYTS